MSQEFFRDQHFFLLPVSRGSRERKSALMARGLLCLAALSGQPPEPGGSRRKARGVDGESARRATIVSGHYAAYVFCVPDPLSLVKFRLRRSPFAMRRCRVEDWRAGLGRSSCSLLARPFVCECHSISTMLTFPIPATSNAAHGFPAYTLTCLLHLKGYGTYPAGATFGCSLLTL